MISVMSIRPAFDRLARLLLALRFGAGNGWSPMTSPSRRTLLALNSFRHQYVARSPGTRCWLSRLSDRLGRVKTFSGLLAVAIYSILATSQELSVHDQVALHAQKAQQFLRANQPDRAIPEFRSILALEPGNVDAVGNLGVLLYFQGDYAGAIPQLQTALKFDPSLWKIQALLGMAQRRTGDSVGSMSNLEQAFPKLEDRGIQIEVGMELVETYASREQLEQAAHVLQLLHENFPTDVGVLYASYRIYSDLAGEAMLSLSLVAPHSAQVRQLMAHELARQGQIDAAIRNYKEAVKINPNVPGLHFELAEALNASGVKQNKDEARKEYEAALSVNKFDVKSECRLGAIAYDAGDLKESLSHYSQALRFQPDDLDANLGMAKVLIEMKETEKAAAFAEHAVQMDPTSAEAHFRLSTIYRQEHRIADSKHEIEEFQKYRDIKEKLRQMYREMRVRPEGEESEQGMGAK
jgi:tetratricopeptide (TPR) repeat protein